MQNPYTSHLFLSVVLLTFLLSQGNASDFSCLPLESRLGNRDYLDPKNHKYIKTVENAHFNEELRNSRSGGLGGELEYTLNWFPNHHEALNTLMRRAVLEKSAMPSGATHIECRFQWARNVNPNDGMVPFIQADYHYRLGEHDKVPIFLKEAIKIDSNNANVQYNVGLLYYRLEDYENSYRHAKIAYKLGFPLPGLRNLLQEAGYWLP